MTITHKNIRMRKRAAGMARFFSQSNRERYRKLASGMISQAEQHQLLEDLAEEMDAFKREARCCLSPRPRGASFMTLATGYDLVRRGARHVLLEVRRTTPDSRTRSTNSTIVLVEWPMVKKVLVSSLQATKTLDQSASLLTLSARCRKQKRAFVERYCDFKEPTGSAVIGPHCRSSKYPFHARTGSLQFFGAVGSNDRAEDLQDS
jgi:hypothetical protein